MAMPPRELAWEKYALVQCESLKVVMPGQTYGRSVLAALDGARAALARGNGRLGRAGRGDRYSRGGRCTPTLLNGCGGRKDREGKEGERGDAREHVCERL